MTVSSNRGDNSSRRPNDNNIYSNNRPNNTASNDPIEVNLRLDNLNKSNTNNSNRPIQANNTPIPTTNNNNNTNNTNNMRNNDNMVY